MQDKITLGQLLGTDLVDNFEDFNLTEVQQVLAGLASDNAIDIAHAEMLQQKTLYAAELLIEYIAKLVKTVSFLETKLNSIKNKTSLEYKSPDGKTTADMKKQAGEASPEVEKIGIMLAKAKGSKTLLERKYEILIKSHHYYKDIGIGMRKGIVSTNNNNSDMIGWK
jgi:hypothetical protein